MGRVFQIFHFYQIENQSFKKTKEKEGYLVRMQFRLNQELSQGSPSSFRSAAETESDRLLLTLNNVPPCVSTQAAAEHQEVSSLDK